jgi:hypothetical protein
MVCGGVVVDAIKIVAVRACCMRVLAIIYSKMRQNDFETGLKKTKGTGVAGAFSIHAC